MTAGALFSARVEHASRLLMLASLVCAMVTRILVAGDQQARLAVLALIGFSAAFVFSLVSRTTISVLLACTYVAPLLISVWVRDTTGYLVFFVAGFIGVMLPRWSSRRWALPVAWRVPLVGWGLAAAVTWPIVAAREADFRPDVVALLKPVSVYGLPAWTAVVFIADAAAILMLSILWLDWLFATFAGDARGFTRTIIAPLLASATAACAVASYQLVGDISFMNEGWSMFERAAGTMLDANALGAIAVLCSCGCVAWADWGSLRSKIIAVVIFALTSTAVWASGSRTALIAEFAALAWIVGSAIHAGGETAHNTPAAVDRRRARIVRVVIGSVLICAVLYVLKDTGPARRLGWIVPSASAQAVGGFFREMLWNRGGYGTAAVEMIRNHPWFGVGVGTFAALVGDYPVLAPAGPLVPDNAQNWVRHSLAELGIVGSVGWIAWTLAIVVWFARRRAPFMGGRTAMSILGALGSVLLVSQVGMPTQNLAVALTCWTFLFWYVLARSPGGTPSGTTPAAAPWWDWGLACVFIVVFTIGTWKAAVTTLQVPMRARDVGRPVPVRVLPAGADACRGSIQVGTAVQRRRRARADPPRQAHGVDRPSGHPHQPGARARLARGSSRHRYRLSRPPACDHVRGP